MNCDHTGPCQCNAEGEIIVRVTKEMVEKASAAYAEKRHPSRWDGEPWGAAGKANHEAAIRNALDVIFKDIEVKHEQIQAGSILILL